MATLKAYQENFNEQCDLMRDDFIAVSDALSQHFEEQGTKFSVMIGEDTPEPNANKPEEPALLPDAEKEAA